MIFSGLKIPRTTLADAVQGGKNLISVAFEIRSNTSRLLAVVVEEEVDNSEDTVTIVDITTNNNNSPLTIADTVLLNPSQNNTKPSQLLNDPACVAQLISVFDSQAKLIKEDTYGEDLTKMDDCLLNVLQFRLSSYHIPKRVPKSKYNY